MSEDWDLYSVYFELKCPFDFETFDECLVNDRDVIYDGMDFMITDNRKANNYGYWFYVRRNVIDSFQEYVYDNYRDDLIGGINVDFSNKITRRSSGRTNYKRNQYVY